MSMDASSSEFGARNLQETGYDIDSFSSLFPDAKISPTDEDTLSAHVMEFFERRSARFVSPSLYRKGNFKRFFTIEHDTGGCTYVAQQDKKYSEGEAAEGVIYLIDIDSEGNEVGHGEIRYDEESNDPFLKDKPFVEFTGTEEGYKERGLGTRRLVMMNALSQMLYGLPLNSSTNFSDKAAQRIWDKQVESGNAIKYKEGNKDRYKFT